MKTPKLNLYQIKDYSQVHSIQMAYFMCISITQYLWKHIGCLANWHCQNELGHWLQKMLQNAQICVPGKILCDDF